MSLYFLGRQLKRSNGNKKNQNFNERPNNNIDKITKCFSVFNDSYQIENYSNKETLLSQKPFLKVGLQLNNPSEEVKISSCIFDKLILQEATKSKT